MKRYLVLIIFLPLLFPAIAYAQCTMPHGAPDAEMGVIIFNKAHKVMQYCNGDDWIGIWGGRGGSGDATPAGAVMAFDLAACPDGWSEYLPARGRFIRGIDNGAGNDPDGARVAGNIQADAFQGHRHNRDPSGRNEGYLVDSGSLAYQGSGWNKKSATGTRTGDPVTDGSNGTPRTSSETRPKNVALLYCRKN